MSIDENGASGKLAGESSSSGPRLNRVLGLWDLVVYGMILMQLVAPVPIYGLIQERSAGNALLSIIFALFAILFTAISYGRMTTMFPMAGSAYTYVARGVNLHLGFVIGWAMFLDYMIIPLISIIIPALALQRLLPWLPFPLLTLVVAAGMSALNLGGVKATNRVNTIVLIVTGAVLIAFFVLAVRFLFIRTGLSGVFSIKPIYDPEVFNFRSVISGTSLAALTYIGFDGVTTLAEDTVDPKRNIVRATILICLLTGAISGIQLYFFQMTWPDWTTFENMDTAYLDIMKLVGGALLFGIFSVIMSISQFASGMSGQVSAARLLYGMGRDSILPKKIFGYLNKKRHNPSKNIVLLGLFVFIGSLILPLGHACDLLNFGAFLGYMGVNMATIWCYFIKPDKSHRRNIFYDLLLPLTGFGFCLVMWIGLPALSKIVGSAWLLFGLAYYVFKTKGFRERPVLFKFEET
jgi:amino acid transporter